MSVETLIYRSTFIYRNFDVYKCPHFKARRIHVLVTCRRCVLKSLNVDVDPRAVEAWSWIGLEISSRAVEAWSWIGLEISSRAVEACSWTFVWNFFKGRRGLILKVEIGPQGASCGRWSLALVVDESARILLRLLTFHSFDLELGWRVFWIPPIVDFPQLILELGFDSRVVDT